MANEEPAADKVAKLLAMAQDLEVGGRKVSVREFRFGEFPKILALCAPLMGFFVSIYRIVQAGRADIDLGSVGEHGDNLFTICAILISPKGDDAAIAKSKKFVEDLDMADAVKLVSVIVLINADFFSRRVMPTVKGMADKLGLDFGGAEEKSLSTTGASSSASSDPATA